MTRQQEMLQTLTRDLIEARDRLTDATKMGTPLDREELWRCANLIAIAAQEAHHIANQGICQEPTPTREVCGLKCAPGSSMCASHTRDAMKDAACEAPHIQLPPHAIDV